MIVLLVHGLARTPLCFVRLARRLRAAGHAPRTFGYAAWAEPYERILARLVRRMEALADAGRPVVLVGHSLGGLLLRHALPRVPRLDVRHLVMLGTPNRPPRMAARAQRWPLFRAFARSSGALLASAEAYRALPPVAVPYTIVAGTRRFPGMTSIFGDEPNDGLVALSETLVAADDRPVALPVRHPFLMTDRTVMALVLERVVRAEGT